MKKIWILMGAIIMFIACQSSNKYDRSRYFTSDAEQDSLLANIITYLYTKPPHATHKNRFDAPFRGFYTKVLPLFKLQSYFIAPDSVHYFFVIRPVGSHQSLQRGVLGKFKQKNGYLYAFEEVANTPILEQKILIERGEFLFHELVKNTNLNQQLPMKHYIEWPDNMLVYDKELNEWKAIK